MGHARHLIQELDPAFRVRGGLHVYCVQCVVTVIIYYLLMYGYVTFDSEHKVDKQCPSLPNLATTFRVPHGGMEIVNFEYFSLHS